MLNLQKSLVVKDNNIIVNNLLKKYYENISTCGWNLNLELYKNNNKCITLDNISYSPYEYICYLAKQNISKGHIDNFTLSWQLINMDIILASVSGIISYISFNNTIIYKKIFLESFIISTTDEKITHHNIHLRD